MPRKRKKEPVVEEPEQTGEVFEDGFLVEPETLESPVFKQPDEKPEPTAEDELETIRGIAEEFPEWPGATDTTLLERQFGPAYKATLLKLKAACK